MTFFYKYNKNFFTHLGVEDNTPPHTHILNFKSHNLKSEIFFLVLIIPNVLAFCFG
tara:strand:- start:60 stop:227 length:168 start_codon:yes stop_codon:yes gene_type:complete